MIRDFVVGGGKSGGNGQRRDKFLCKRLGITRYYPLTAGILLLPLSAWYFSFFLYGTYYMPRVSMMFFILGVLVQPPAESYSKAKVIINTLLACLFSLALGMEGARMMLILFVPVTIVAGTELFRRTFSHNRENSTKKIAQLCLEKIKPALDFFDIDM